MPPRAHAATGAKHVWLCRFTSALVKQRTQLASKTGNHRKAHVQTLNSWIPQYWYSSWKPASWGFQPHQDTHPHTHQTSSHQHRTVFKTEMITDVVDVQYWPWHTIFWTPCRSISASPLAVEARETCCFETYQQDKLNGLNIDGAGGFLPAVLILQVATDCKPVHYVTFRVSLHVT